MLPCATMPDTMDDQIRHAVESFVTDISGLVRQAALEAAQDALGAAHVRPPPQAFGRRSPRGHGSGHNRSPEALERITHRLHEHIRQNPGQRMEEIARALGVPSRELMLPAKKLIQAGSVKTKGAKRATTYWGR